MSSIVSSTGLTVLFKVTHNAACRSRAEHGWGDGEGISYTIQYKRVDTRRTVNARTWFGVMSYGSGSSCNSRRSRRIHGRRSISISSGGRHILVSSCECKPASNLHGTYANRYCHASTTMPTLTVIVFFVCILATQYTYVYIQKTSITTLRAQIVIVCCTNGNCSKIIC